MSPGKHSRGQTAFRLPEAVLVWLRGQARCEGRPMTHIVIEALEAYRAGVMGLNDQQEKVHQAWDTLSRGHPGTSEWEAAADFLIGLQFIDEEGVGVLAQAALEDRSTANGRRRDD